MLNIKNLLNRYRKQALQPAYVVAYDDKHVDVDAQSGHIDNGQ